MTLILKEPKMTNAELIEMKDRVKRTFNRSNINPLESCRNRLGLSYTEFSLALGYSENSYSTWVRDGEAPAVAALAAECLVRRQAPNAEQAYLTRYIKGTLVSTPIDASRKLTLDGKTYILVEDK